MNYSNQFNLSDINHSGLYRNPYGLYTVRDHFSLHPSNPYPTPHSPLFPPTYPLYTPFHSRKISPPLEKSAIPTPSFSKRIDSRSIPASFPQTTEARSTQPMDEESPYRYRNYSDYTFFQLPTQSLRSSPSSITIPVALPDSATFDSIFSLSTSTSLTDFSQKTRRPHPPTFDSSLSVTAEPTQPPTFDSDLSLSTPQTQLSDSPTSDSDLLMSSVDSDSLLPQDIGREKEKESKLKETSSKKPTEESLPKMLKTLKKIKNFELRMVKTIKSPIEQEDRTKLGEDFRSNKFSFQHIGYRHLKKRLNFFLTMSRYISENAIYLKKESFPLIVEKNQFRATKYMVPKFYLTDHPNNRYGFTRAHISLLNKIALLKEGVLVEMTGTLPNKKTTLADYFNICDIVPPLVNSIDWYAEFYLREKANAHLSNIKDRTESYTKGTESLAKEYLKCLNELKDNINQNGLTIDKIHKGFSKNLIPTFKRETSIMLKNKESTLKCIDGMIKATREFIAKFKSSDGIK